MAVNQYVQMKAEESAKDLEQFQSSALRAELAIQNTISSKLNSLYALRDAFAVSNQHMSRNGFKILASSVYERTKGMQALEWIPRVSKEERLAYKLRAQKEGLPNFMIKEPDGKGGMKKAEESDEYYPVYYVEPLSGNEKAVGFNLASNPARREALKKALGTGGMVASSRIRLVQEKGSQNGILIFYPQVAGATSSNNKGSDNLFLAVFRVGDMVSSAFFAGLSS